MLAFWELPFQIICIDIAIFYYYRNGKWIYKYKELHSLYQTGILRVVLTYLHPICTTHAGIHSASHLHVTTFDHMSVS